MLENNKKLIDFKIWKIKKNKKIKKIKNYFLVAGEIFYY
jgi:hypothetical protein